MRLGAGAAALVVLVLGAACTSGADSDAPSTSTPPATSAEHNTAGCAAVRSSADALAVSAAGASPAVQVENARQAHQLLLDRPSCFDEAYRSPIEREFRDLTG